MLDASATAAWVGTQVVVTKKMDGEQTTMYCDGLHARSMEFTNRLDRDRIRAIHGEIAYEIPEGMRICGENLTATHSIKYRNLKDWFYVYSVWEGTACLSWKETLAWCGLLGLTRASGKPLCTVPLVYWGEYRGDAMLKEMCAKIDPLSDEGLVVRPAESFDLKDFHRLVGKYVRPNHIQTDAHWTEHIEFNEIG
jgi:hypothetical protein